MSAYEDLRKRKRELEEEIQVVEGLLKFSLRRFERYSPQQVLARTVTGLLKRLLFKTFRLVGQRMAGQVPEYEQQQSANGQGDFWREMSHQGLDLLLNYLESRKQEPKEEEAVAAEAD
jgi:hypothetical protein